MVNNFSLLLCLITLLISCGVKTAPTPPAGSQLAPVEKAYFYQAEKEPKKVEKDDTEQNQKD